MGACRSVIESLDLHTWKPVAFSGSGSSKQQEVEWMKECLLKTPSFADLSDRRVEELLECMIDPSKHSERSLHAGELLCKIHDKSDCFWYVRKGELSVFTADGKEVARKIKGELTGEVGMIQGVDRTATLKASRVTQVLRILKEDYERISQKQRVLEDSLSYSSMMKTNLFTGWDKRTVFNVLDIMRGTVAEKRMVLKSGTVKIIPAREKTDEERFVKPNDVIMKKGDKPHPFIPASSEGKKKVPAKPATDFMYIVEKGSCLAIVDDEPRVMNTNTFLIPAGKFFGEKALLNDTPRAATVVAGPEGCTLLSINKDQFTKYFGKERARFELNIITLERSTQIAKAGKSLDVSVEERRSKTNKRGSIRLDDFDEKYEMIKSVKVTKGAPAPGSAAPTPAAVNAAKKHAAEEEEGIGAVLFNPTKWLDWVPPLTSGGIAPPPKPPAQ